MYSERISKEHEHILRFYIRQINKDNHQEKLSEIYRYVKSITNSYYNQECMQKGYLQLREYIIEAEAKFPREKLLQVPVFINKSEEKEDFIKYIVNSARKRLLKECTYGLENKKIEDIDLTDHCRNASIYIKKLCNDNHVESYLLPIYPGYKEKAYLYDGAGYHFANTIKYDGKYYLIDVTYSQFFYTKRNNLDRLGIVDMSGCTLGIFMLMTDKGKYIDTTLLRDGYIELNEEIFKIYLDAFAISFRNGLYYERTNDFSYTTQYQLDDYIHFLQEEDNQINHEGKENLGFQKKPLKNCNLKFR